MSPGNLDTSFHAHCPLCGGTEWAFVRKFGTSEIDYEIRECTNRIPFSRDPMVHVNCGFIHRLQGKDTPNETISNKVKQEEQSKINDALSSMGLTKDRYSILKRDRVRKLVFALMGSGIEYDKFDPEWLVLRHKLDLAGPSKEIDKEHYRIRSKSIVTVAMEIDAEIEALQ